MKKIIPVIAPLAIFLAILFGGVAVARAEDGYGTIDLINRTQSGTRDIETWENDLIIGAGKNAMVALCGGCYTVEDLTVLKPEDFKSMGILGGLNGVIANSLTNPPSLDTMRYLASAFVPFSKVSYAQTGKQFLDASNILSLWQISRNVAYIVLIIVLLGAGFAIMFRAKIDPKTVISVQMVLPGIAVALVVITFSYAIGGFILDLTNTLLSLIMNVYSPDRLSNLSFLATTIMTQLANLSLPGIVNPWLGRSLGSKPAGHGLPQELPGMSALHIDVVGDISTYIIGPLIGFMVLIALFNVFLALFSEWVQIFLRTAFGPLFILMGALPSQDKAGKFAWLKELLASAISIPIMALMLDISFRFAVGRDFGPSASSYGLQIDAPPLLSNTNWRGGAGGTNISGNTQYVERIAAFGILLAVTSIPAAVRNAFGILTPGAVAGASQKASQLQSTAAMIQRAIP
ncbi:hypothetical protein L6255_03220 [Candidatus Parcubacteria bacterium]|nr:hypothetical protein [Patescibacteria group bacterium]MCG2689423.1 hypothetical protein [Candidatus Parcubacteria bacterium]